MPFFPTKCFNIILITLFFSQHVSSQSLTETASDLTGKWYGQGDADTKGNINNYLCELDISGEGTSVNGYFNYYFRDTHKINYVTGDYDPQTRSLKLNATPILYYYSDNPGDAVDCNMTGSFTLDVSKKGRSLKGTFLSDEFHQYTAPQIKVDLVKETDEKIVEPDPNDLERKKLHMRRKDLVRIIDFTDDTVKVELYDNGDFDYDTSSIFFNDNLVISKQLLQTKTPITFYVTLDSVETNNDLVMYAENLGLIPPNSGLMVLTDKTHRYEVSMESDYIKSATVRLRKVPKPKYKAYQL